MKREARKKKKGSGGGGEWGSFPRWAKVRQLLVDFAVPVTCPRLICAPIAQLSCCQGREALLHPPPPSPAPRQALCSQVGLTAPCRCPAHLSAFVLAVPAAFSAFSPSL